MSHYSHHYDLQKACKNVTESGRQWGWGEAAAPAPPTAHSQVRSQDSEVEGSHRSLAGPGSRATLPTLQVPLPFTETLYQKAVEKQQDA